MGRVKKKLVIVGDAGVGKTSLLMQYYTGRYGDDFLPISWDKHVVKIEVNGKQVDLELWDPAQVALDGGVRSSRRRSIVYGDVDVILACFSVDHDESLMHLDKVWLPLVQHYSSDAPIILLGMRVDLRSDDVPIAKLVPVQKARAIASHVNARAYLECSAKSGRGVAKAFQEAARLAMEHKKKHHRCTIS